MFLCKLSHYDIISPVERLGVAGINRNPLWSRPYRPPLINTFVLAEYLYGIFAKLPGLATSQDMEKV